MAKANVVSVIVVTILIKSATSNVDVEHIQLNDIALYGCMCIWWSGICEWREDVRNELLVRPFDIRFRHIDDFIDTLTAYCNFA